MPRSNRKIATFGEGCDIALVSIGALNFGREAHHFNIDFDFSNSEPRNQDAEGILSHCEMT